MAVSGASETSVSRKRMRFTVPPADTYSGSWGYHSEEEIQEHSESDGGNEERQDEEDEQGQVESQRDQEPSESDGCEDSPDEEDEQVEQERQMDQESSESDGEDEEQDEVDEMDQESLESDSEDEVPDEVDEQVEQERQMDQESSESDGEEEEQDEVDGIDQESSESDTEDEVPDEVGEQRRQMDQESSESNGEDEEQDEVAEIDEESSESDSEDEVPDEVDEQERQMDQESSESDGEDEEPDEVDGIDQESSESDTEDEVPDEVDEQVEQERQIDEEVSESDDENDEQNVDEDLAEEESQSIQAPVESSDSDEGGHGVEDEQVEQETQINRSRSELDSEDLDQIMEEVVRELESRNNQASVDAAGGNEEEQEEEDEQVEDVSDGGRVQKSSSEPVLAPAPSKRTAIANMTLDEDMLDCGVCCLPLKPPIFQCAVGHVVCTSCQNKLATAGKCHVCRTYFAGGYRRCHALEQLVESIRGSCPNATYGCTARVPYYDLHAHLLECPHAPCHCPAEACGFVGSTSALLHHFAGTHKWPCITGVQNRESRATDLHDGFNVVAVVHDAKEYLFLLTVARTPFGRAISSLCLHPQAAAVDNDSSPSSPSNSVNCQLHLSYARDIVKDFDLVYHSQVSSYRVACSDLSNGMPNPNDCFQFIVPNAVQPETEATVSVKACFYIQ